GVEGSVVAGGAEEVALALARAKAADVAAKHRDAIVIGADTVVVVDGDVMGKPVDGSEAAEFLSKLSGRTHTVVTGVAVRRESDGVELFGKEATRVRFRDLSADEIDAYVRSGEPDDKAGAYAIQGLGAAFVESIDGCYFNVVGLPVVLLFDLLKRV
ncbi:MAG: Maf family protein, partial [bacterium]|nr:Maf family protein [bacterium]